MFVPFQHLNRMLNLGFCCPPLCWQGGKTGFILKLMKLKLQDSSIASPLPRPWESLGNEIMWLHVLAEFAKVRYSSCNALGPWSISTLSFLFFTFPPISSGGIATGGKVWKPASKIQLSSLLSLGTLDILGWIILWCLATSLAFTNLMPVAPSPSPPQLWQPKMFTDISKCPLGEGEEQKISLEKVPS